jgi:peptide chain release factor 1
MMNEATLKRLEDIEKRFKEIKQRLADPNIFKDKKQFVELSKEHSELADIAKLCEEYREISSRIDEDENVIETSNDDELVDIATEELNELKPELNQLESKIMTLLHPKDKLISRNAIMEIRAGAGGNEASLFAKNLFRMYSKYVEKKGWSIEPIDVHPTEIGGFKEIVYMVHGKGAYGKLKYESGVHRVQRVPVTESGGRIHTSTSSVAVLPEASDIDLKINPKDLKIESFRSSGPGGQSVNKLSSAVRITHIPTGIVASCQDERSQHKNKIKAMKVLMARLYDIKRKEEEDKIRNARKAQIGEAERAEKVRTYNFREKRVTDHRINFTIYKLDAILEGDLDELIERVAAAANEN